MEPMNPAEIRTVKYSLAFGGGSLLGLVLGVVYGFHEYIAAVDKAEKAGGPGDFLPVGIPIWGLVGVFLGPALAGILIIAWKCMSTLFSRGGRCG